MDDRPTFDQINLVVRDVGAAVEFYRLLGVAVDDPPAPWTDHHRTVESPEGIDLEIDSRGFAPQWNEGWPHDRTGTVLGFRVSDRGTVDDIYTRLTAAGHHGQQPPYDAFWGSRYAIVADPDGNAVGIMSAADPARRTAPPDPGNAPARG